MALHQETDFEQLPVGGGQNRVAGPVTLRRIAAGLCLALALVVLASGCVTQRAANLITTAPNLQSGQPDFPFEKSLREHNGGTNPFTAFTLTVGPPEAKLAGLQ